MRHANDTEDCEWMQLSVEVSGSQTHWELWTRARESCLSCGAELTRVHSESTIRIAFELREVARFDLRRMHLVSQATLAEAAERVLVSITWAAGAL
jgi:tRNA1(Val) A37 N6-methylase TrmN6